MKNVEVKKIEKVESLKNQLKKIKSDSNEISLLFENLPFLESLKLIEDPKYTQKIKFLFDSGRISNSREESVRLVLKEIEDKRLKEEELLLGNEENIDTAEFIDENQYLNDWDFVESGSILQDDFEFDSIPDFFNSDDDQEVGDIFGFDKIPNIEEEPSPTQLFNNAIEERRQTLKNAIFINLNDLGYNMGYGKKEDLELKTKLEEKINAMDLPELMMVRFLATNVIYLFGQKIVKSGLTDALIDYLSIDRDSYSFDIPKTGSELKVFKNAKSGNISFINTINNDSFNTWEKASKLIPTAQIINPREKGSDNTISQVVSRYSGLSINQLEIISNQKLLENKEFQDFMVSIRNIKDQLIATLDINNIDHGHTHEANFTVEFIPKNLITTEHVDNNYNNLPIEVIKQIEFNPAKYFENPNEYEVCVRLIDWDRAQ
jgi:plasmid stability protein